MDGYRAERSSIASPPGADHFELTGVTRLGEFRRFSPINCGPATAENCMVPSAVISSGPPPNQTGRYCSYAAEVESRLSCAAAAPANGGQRDIGCISSGLLTSSYLAVFGILVRSLPQPSRLFSFGQIIGCPLPPISTVALERIDLAELWMSKL